MEAAETVESGVESESESLATPKDSGTGVYRRFGFLLYNFLFCFIYFFSLWNINLDSNLDKWTG